MRTPSKSKVIRFRRADFGPEDAVPAEYRRLPMTDPFARGKARQLAAAAGKTLYVECRESGKDVWWIPPEIRPEVKRLVNERRVREARNVPRTLEALRRRMRREVERLTLRALEMYPGLPADKCLGIAVHAAGAEGDDDFKLGAALRTEVRFNQTDWYAHFMGGRPPELLRRAIGPLVDRILDGYRNPTPLSPPSLPPPLDAVLEINDFSHSVLAMPSCVG
jgi:hypothetical protein